VRPTPKIEILLLLISVCSVAASGQTNPFTLSQNYCAGVPCVLTHHNDNNRDGVNPSETVFKASTLSYSSHPTPQWLAATDGLIYAQPLYIHQLSINGLTKNVVYAFTENNSVYAFDADSTSATGTVLKQVSLNNPVPNYAETAVPNADLPGACSTIVPEVGITGTPVIDVSVTPPVIYLGVCPRIHLAPNLCLAL
jgi:hypothetical protein